MNRKIFFIIAAGLVLGGCMTIGKPFPVTQVPFIRVGLTTQKDMLETFGNPDRTGLDDGDVTWTYMHYKLRLLGAQDTRDLYVRFNREGTVKSYSFNSSLEEDQNLLRRVAP